MKTTQLTSKVLVASMLLTLVSPVLAGPTKLQLVKDFFMPVRYEDAAEKEAVLAKYPKAEADIKAQQERIKDLEGKIKAESEKKFTDKEEAQAQAGYIKELKNTLSDYKWTLGFRGSLNKAYDNNPNVFKYTGMTAVAALVTAAVTAAVKYELPQRAFNKIKSLFGFGKSALDPITAQAEKLANGDVEGTLVATLEVPAIKSAVASLKTSRAELEKAVKTFDVNLKAKTAVDVALSNVKLAVEEANKELATQEAKAKSETTKSETTTTTEEQKKEQPATSVKTNRKSTAK